MLWLAGVGKGDVVYDLGSGDGRVVIAAVRDFGAAKAVGIEIDPKLVHQSRMEVEKAGLADRVQIIQGDLFAEDFSRASVVFLYLGHRPNIDLRTKLYRMLKPGARVVSHQFGMGEWRPDKLLQVRTQYLGMFGVLANPFSDNPRVPDYGDAFDVSRNSTVRVWIMPAPVAGVWRGKLSTPNGDRKLKLILYQRLSEVTGSFELQGSDKLQGYLQADVWGNQLRFDGGAKGKSYAEFHLMFDGHASGDMLKGRLGIFERDKTREYQWAGQRDNSDFIGTWEWECPTGSRTVQLQIKRHEGRFVALYADRGQTLRVEDFYDFGGGFYFTYMVGRQPTGGVLIGRDTGWLIGCAAIGTDGLDGTIEFYPYPGQPKGKNGLVPEGPRKWSPKRVTR